MKALTLNEPWGTLIKEKTKYIETRSWRTNYRGEIYIHIGVKKISKDLLENKELMNLVKDKNYKYGYIVCRCKLKDCIPMTEEFINELKKNNYTEYLCGIYGEGRYAWILEDIEVLDNPIKAKGQLGLWNYKEV